MTTEIYKLRELTEKLSPSPSGTPAKMRVAYIDDEKSDFELLSRLFDPKIVEIDFFESSTKFISAVESKSYEMALIDISMHVTGNHIVNLITKPRKKDMKIYLFTGVDPERARSLVDLHGNKVDGIISKNDILEMICDEKDTCNTAS